MRFRKQAEVKEPLCLHHFNLVQIDEVGAMNHQFLPEVWVLLFYWVACYSQVIERLGQFSLWSDSFDLVERHVQVGEVRKVAESFYVS